MNTKESALKSFGNLLKIMDELREKCPWDKKQTFQSLKKLTIEEVYELAEAIQLKDVKEIKNELGDILLHIVFYSKIANEHSQFNITDVIDTLCQKLIIRHPHIYGDAKAEHIEEVKSNWEKIKLKNGQKGVLSGVPNTLPAMIKAYRMQEKVASIGFDFKDKVQVKEKIDEELNEFYDALKKQNAENIESEFGDLIFSLINYARHLQIDPDTALNKTNIKFKKRVEWMENNTSQPLYELSLSQMDLLWEKAKKEET